MALKKICPICGRVIDYNKKMCDECAKRFNKNKKERYKEYKRNRKDKKEQKFYCSGEWLRVRDMTRTKYKGLCLYSYYINHEIKYVDVIHHIVELKEDWGKRLDIDNLITCCDGVHKLIHKVYLRNNKDKKEMQELLRNLIIKYEKEFGTNNY